SADNKTVTMVFDMPFSDWFGLITNQGMVPVNAVAKLAGFIDAKAIRTAYEAKDMVMLQKIVTAWNTGFKTDQGLKLDIMLSGGSYKISEYVPDQSVTLVRNEKFWGSVSGFDKIVFRIITDDTV